MRHFINLVEALSPRALKYRPKIRVYGIEWDLDIDRDDYPDEDEYDTMVNYLLQERGLPEQVIIPSGDSADWSSDEDNVVSDYICDWLSDEYGYCTQAFSWAFV
jgi:hypothetical protein